VRHYKGLDVALRALQQTVTLGYDVRLTVAGEFWQPKQSYRSLVDALGLGDRVDLQPGYVSDDRLEHLLATHHCVIAPYRSASQSGILPIALMADRPVITTRIEGLTQVVHDGVNGLVAAPDDVDDLARCLGEMQASVLRLHRGARAAGNPDWESVGVAILKAASLG
jgi:glycosyltransferase involved in cell wall biosynthesis